MSKSKSAFAPKLHVIHNTQQTHQSSLLTKFIFEEDSTSKSGYSWLVRESVYRILDAEAKREINGVIDQLLSVVNDAQARTSKSHLSLVQGAQA